MLTFPATADHVVRVVSIDPGGDTLGMAAQHLDVVAHTDTVVDAITLKAARAIKRTTRFDHWVSRFGDRHARRAWQAEQLYSFLEYHDPHAVVAESPFMFAQPQAFQSLTETLTMVRDVAMSRNPEVHFDTVAPTAAKKIWDVAWKGAKKEDVRAAFLTRLTDPDQYRLYYEAQRHPETLDEHSVDAILVGYHFFKQWGGL